MSLSPNQIDQFIEDGYVRIDNAFSNELAAECRAIIDQAAGVKWNEPSTWRDPPRSGFAELAPAPPS